MSRYTLHALLSAVSGLGLIAIGGVMFERFGLDVYVIGFVGLGVLSLWRTVPPLVLPGRFDRSRVSQGQLAIDVIGIVLVGVALWLFVFERTSLMSQISV